MEQSSTLSPDGKKLVKIFPKVCPVCGIAGNYVYCMEEGTSGRRGTWYRCHCGVIFQENFPKHEIYNADYIDVLKGDNESEQRKLKEQHLHAARTYVPIIEELTYGRMVLDVGFGLPYNIDYFRERGWLAWGIDCNTETPHKKNIYKGDYLTFDFSPQIDPVKLKSITGKEKLVRTFDLIWMSHVLSNFNDPILALQKTYNLLAPDGVVYISVPDIEGLHKRGVTAWQHWKMQETYTMWSERALRRELERLHFKVIMSRRNLADRFGNQHDDIHLIAQKDYF